jgi:hypothetical protein
MSQPMKAQTLFENIEQFVAESHSLLEKGAIMELAGLDEHVRSLCDQVLSMSQDDRILYADKLQKLLGDLKNLGEALAQQRDAVASEIRNMSKHQKANVAYKVADASDDYGNKDG